MTTQPTLSSHQMARLRGLAQRLDADLIVGKEGLTDPFVNAVAGQLDRRELVKVRFGAGRDQKRALAADLAGRTGSVLVTIVGHVAVFYRQHPDPSRRTVSV